MAWSDELLENVLVVPVYGGHLCLPTIPVQNQVVVLDLYWVIQLVKLASQGTWIQTLDASFQEWFDLYF